MALIEETGWPRLLQFIGHEFRNAVGVVKGHATMLRSGRGGPLTDMQRFMSSEIEKVADRMLVILADMSAVAAIESGRATFKLNPVDLRRVLSDAIASLPVDESRNAEVILASGNGAIQVSGDETRLKSAFTSIFWALRRELASSDQLLVRSRKGEFRGSAAEWITVADPEQIEELETATPETLTEFNEYRGGCGLSLAVARRVIDGHGGALWSPGQGTKAGAVVALPRS